MGWQEIWKTAPYAELYASSSGIELISKYSTEKIESIKENVYKNVTHAMDINVETKDLIEKEMRDKNVNITLRDVKILVATYGINQIFSTYEKMKEKLYSRRYVMTIYDPQKDSSLKIIDCPCNNWIQLIVTPDKKLNFYVTLRANDKFGGEDCFK